MRSTFIPTANFKFVFTTDPQDMNFQARFLRPWPFAIATVVYSFSVVAQARQACVAPVVPTVDWGFSPEGSAEQLVLDAICRAQRSIHVSAYSFTSEPIATALIAARKRGVDVLVAADRRINLVEDHNGRAIKVFDQLTRAGIRVRVVDAYPSHHDKAMVIDGDSVETGSFNFTAFAARRNSENAVVIWHVAPAAQAFDEHWKRRFDQGRPWQARASN